MATTTTAPRVTRLAPSPTGALHLGNARTFLLTWAIAVQRGWRVVLRIEDLDTPRVKPSTIAATIDLLAWLGLTWTSGPVVQSADLEPYRGAARRLATLGLIYPSAYTRRDVELAGSAPNEGDHETRFPPGLRPPPGVFAFDDERTNWRLRVEAGPVEVEDEVLGRRALDPSLSVGDFPVWTRAGQPAYQLAVVVDDAAQGVTDVVRGADLLDSAARQTLLYRALRLDGPPRWWHLPLVRGPDGRRLAKRHGDTRIEAYREAGVPAERIVGLAACWSGVVPTPRAMTASEFAGAFTIEALPRVDVTFTEEDHRWLLAG